MSQAASLPNMMELLHQYIFPLVPSDPLEGILHGLSNPETPMETVNQHILDHRLFVDGMRRLDFIQGKISQWNQEEETFMRPDQMIPRITALIGRDATRGVVMTAYFDFLLKGDRSMVDPTKVELLNPRNAVQFATATRDFCDNNKVLELEIAYDAGLHYDWLLCLMQKKGGAALAEKGFLEKTWKESLDYGKRAFDIAAQEKQLRMGKYAFSAAVLTGVGKVLAAITYPISDPHPWKAWYTNAQKKGPVAGRLRAEEEKKLYRITHAEMTMMAVRAVGLFKNISLATLCYQEPYLAKNIKDGIDSYQLARVLERAKPV